MTLSPEIILMGMGGMVALVTTVFHVGMYVGRLATKVDGHDVRIGKLETRHERVY